MRISEGIEKPTIESLLRALLAFVAAGAPLDTPVTAIRSRSSEVIAIEADFGSTHLRCRSAAARKCSMPHALRSRATSRRGRGARPESRSDEQASARHRVERHRIRRLVGPPSAGVLTVPACW